VKRESLGGLIEILLTSLGAAAFVSVFLSYRRDIRRARERISVGSRIAETRFGSIEYAIAGSGPPILVVQIPRSSQTSSFGWHPEYFAVG
jgi:hypothetical protein